MLLILDGNLEACAHVKLIIFNFMCSRHLLRSREVTNWLLFFFPKTFFSVRNHGSELGKPQQIKSSFFSGPATKRGGGKGLATKKKELFLKL